MQQYKKEDTHSATSPVKKSKKKSNSLVPVRIGIALVVGIFSQHNAAATPAQNAKAKTTANAEVPGNAALGKDSTSTSSSSKSKAIQFKGRPSQQVDGHWGLFCSTSFSHDEPGVDNDTSHFRSATGVKLQYLEPGQADQIGTAAVDPNVIPYGSLIVFYDGGRFKMFAAVNTGSAVKSCKASRLRARAHHIEDARYSKAPVIDFFMPGAKSLGKEWDNFYVIPYDGTRPFMKLSRAEKSRCLALSIWKDRLERNGFVLSEKAEKVRVVALSQARPPLPAWQSD